MIWFVWAALLSAPAIVLDDTLALDLAAGAAWKKVDPPEGMLLRLENGAETVSVARSRGNTDAVYVKEERASFLEGVEQGVKDENPGYRRISATERMLGPGKKFPALDLWWSASGGVRGMRFLFFRGYMVVLALASPAKRPSREHRRIVESFVPVVTKIVR